MQKHLSLVFFLVYCLFCNQSLAQSQRGFGFQGYARDFEGAALSSQGITVRFSIYPQGGSNQFEETQSATTDPYGVFSLTIGSTKPADFAKVDFSANKYWLKVETKAYGSEFVEISNTELMAVPYAKSAENGVPSGTILPFGGPKSKIPAGYLACDGAIYNSTMYPTLFNAIGNAWGGSGTSFNVPDLRGQFLRGAAEGQGTDPDRGSRYAKHSGGASGDNVGSYQNNEMQSHNHSGNTSTNGNHSHTWLRGMEGDDSGSGGSHSEFTNIGGSHNSVIGAAGDHSHSLNVNSTGGSETRPNNAYVLYIIKY
jgi:microcystin-dependent protein